MSEKDVVKLLKEVDKNGDGSVDIGEFLNMMQTKQPELTMGK